MSDPFPADSFADQAPDVSLRNPPLPAWLARRLFPAEETVAWVRGPRRNPWWERGVIHPALFLLALAVGAACLAAGRLLAGTWSDDELLPRRALRGPRAPSRAGGDRGGAPFAQQQKRDGQRHN